MATRKQGKLKEAEDDKLCKEDWKVWLACDVK